MSRAFHYFHAAARRAYLRDAEGLHDPARKRMRLHRVLGGALYLTHTESLLSAIADCPECPRTRAPEPEPLARPAPALPKTITAVSPMEERTGPSLNSMHQVQSHELAPAEKRIEGPPSGPGTSVQNGEVVAAISEEAAAPKELRGDEGVTTSTVVADESHPPGQSAVGVEIEKE